MLAISKRYLLRPTLRQGFLEEGLMGHGRAGRHHHPVEVVFLDDGCRCVTWVSWEQEKRLSST